MIESLIMGFGHRARHGKDTVAAEIIRRRSGSGPGWYQIKHMAFAHALKKEVNDMAISAGGMKNLFLRSSFPEWVTYDPSPDMSDPYSPLGKQRKLLQWYGSYRREQDENYWVKRVISRIEKERPEICIITDLRYSNEMAFVQEYGDAIKVERRNPDGSLYVAPGVIPHPSEEVLADVPNNQWDAILTNDGTLEELKDAGVKMFDMLMERLQ